MSLFYKVKDEQLLKDRNDLFKDAAIPSLIANKFIETPYKTAWRGEYNKSIEGYMYDFSRLTDNNELERIYVYISKGERWIQMYLNIFKLSPNLTSLNVLKNYDGLNFNLHPNSLTRMRLRNDDYKGPPLFYMLFLPEYKIENYYTKVGYEEKLDKLKKLIKYDMENINRFVQRWHELYKPKLTDWEGNILT